MQQSSFRITGNRDAMTLSHSVKVTHHMSCILSYSSFWSHWSTAKQHSRSWCLTYLKIRLVQHTLQLRHLGCGPWLTSNLSWREAPGRGSEATQALVQTSQLGAHRLTQHPVATSVLENPPLPSVGQACTLHLPHTHVGTFLSSHNTFKLEYGVQTTTTWHKQMQLF